MRSSTGVQTRWLASNLDQTAGGGVGHTFRFATLRSSSALLRSSPCPASSRSSSRRLSRSSCWNSRSSKSFVSVSRSSASFNDNDKGGWVVLEIPLWAWKAKPQRCEFWGLDPGKVGKGPDPSQPPFLRLALSLSWASLPGATERRKQIPPNPSLSPPNHSTDPGVQQVLQGPGGPVPPLSSFLGRWPSGRGRGAGETDPSQLLL